MIVPGMFVCSSFLISVCMFIVSKALLISSATVIVRAGGAIWLNPFATVLFSVHFPFPATNKMGNVRQPWSLLPRGHWTSRLSTMFSSFVRMRSSVEVRCPNSESGCDCYVLICVPHRLYETIVSRSIFILLINLSNLFLYS